MYLNWILKVHFFLRVTSLFLVTVIMSQRQLLSDWKVNPEAFSGSIDVHPGQHTGALCIEPLSCLEWILVEVICATNCKNAENTSLVCLVPCCQEDFLCQGLILHSGTSLWVADVSAAASELWQSDFPQCWNLRPKWFSHRGLLVLLLCVCREVRWSSTFSVCFFFCCPWYPFSLGSVNKGGFVLLRQLLSQYFSGMTLGISSFSPFHH